MNRTNKVSIDNTIKMEELMMVHEEIRLVKSISETEYTKIFL